MEKESIEKQVLHLRTVEKLTFRQIAQHLGIGRRHIRRILGGEGVVPRPLKRPSLLDRFQNLIAHWYSQYPRLKAIQIYARLKPYGYEGSYPTVVSFTKTYREKRRPAYHTLTFLPGEEAQVDWFFFKHETLGMLAGFLYVLAYSRYAWGVFYPKTSFEFFLAGHLECFRHLGGLARRHRYDNLKSVILKREPRMEYNPQFLDFAKFHGFSIYVCNPYKGNEKGRVERIIRDIRVFLYGETFTDLSDLNRRFHDWLSSRNERIHRATDKTPKELLATERLLPLPGGTYAPTRILPARVSKTALVEFETNRYSVPTGCVGKQADIVAYPERIEIFIGSGRVAVHKRSFKQKQLIQNPLHAERLLDRSPRFKYERILTLIGGMNRAFGHFLDRQEDHEAKLQAAYELFGLLRSYSRAILSSAVGELNRMGAFKLKALRSLLHLPEPKEGSAVWPQNTQLLNMQYESRSLGDYDPAK